jgi:hypothetical protein
VHDSLFHPSAQSTLAVQQLVGGTRAPYLCDLRCGAFCILRTLPLYSRSGLSPFHCARILATAMHAILPCLCLRVALASRIGGVFRPSTTMKDSWPLLQRKRLNGRNGLTCMIIRCAYHNGRCSNEASAHCQANHRYMCPCQLHSVSALISHTHNAMKPRQQWQCASIAAWNEDDVVAAGHGVFVPLCLAPRPMQS